MILEVLPVMLAGRGGGAGSVADEAQKPFEACQASLVCPDY